MKVVPINVTVSEGDVILVNADYAFQNNDEEDLVSVSCSYPDILVKKIVAENLKQVFQKIDCNDCIVPVSGYRSAEEQTQIYETSIREKVHETIDSKLDGKTIVKEIYVKNKIYNIVVK